MIRKMDRLSEYIEELQPWTLQINNLLYDLMSTSDLSVDNRSECIGREGESNEVPANAALTQEPGTTKW